MKSVWSEPEIEIVRRALKLSDGWDAASVAQHDLDTAGRALNLLLSHLPDKQRTRIIPPAPKKMGRPRKADAFPLACQMRDYLDAGLPWREARAKLNTQYRLRWDERLAISDDTLERNVKWLRAGQLRPTLWKKSEKT
jgi:hypothetical protein